MIIPNLHLHFREAGYPPERARASECKAVITEGMEGVEGVEVICSSD